MLQAFTERRDSGQQNSPTQEKSSTWAPNTKQNTASKPKVNHKRKSSAKPKVTFKSQPSSSQVAQNSRSAARRTAQINTNTTPVSKRHKTFASLFVSLLATSPVAIEEDAVDENTVQSANAASSIPLQPKPGPTGAVRSGEIRKTKWKRFKYEMSLKMQSGSKGKERQQDTHADDMELADMQAKSREADRQQAKGNATA